MREVVTLAPLIAATIFFGVYPSPVFNVTSVSVEHLIANYTAAVEAHRVAEAGRTALDALHLIATR